MRKTRNNIIISIILSFFIITGIGLNFNLSAEIAPSPKRLATGDFSDDIYDTYDYLTGRPDMLGKINGVQMIFFPDELAGDIETLLNLIHGNPDVNLNNRIGFGYGAGEFGFGFHFKNLYKERYQDPEYKEDIDITDLDSDGIVHEVSETETTTITAMTNFNKDKNLNLGGGIGFSAGNDTFGMVYQALLDEEVPTNSISYSENYQNKYSSAEILPGKTTTSDKHQITNKNHQHQVIFNFGVDDIRPYLGRNNVMLKKRESLFMLETRLIFFEENNINRRDYLEVNDLDPSGKISTTLSNKIVNDGYSWQPNTEERQTSRGTKLHIKPKFNIAIKKDLNLNIQGKFGIGFNIKNTYLDKSSFSVKDYDTDIPANYQDIYTDEGEIFVDCNGDGNYYMYGLRLEQVFKPKYFTIGIALDATVQQNRSKLTGTSELIFTKKWESTYTNYKLTSGLDKKTITTEYPASIVEIDIKEINTVISMPIGFEFELAKYIKLRTSYTFTIENKYTKTVTKIKGDFTTASSNNGKKKTTTVYEDPGMTNTVVYASAFPLPPYLETTTTEIISDNDISNILSAGFEFSISAFTSFNVVGSYNITRQIGQAIIDVKFRL